MALNEQMKEAIQADIADESSRKERLAKQIEGLKSTGKFIGETAVESVPGVSEAIAAKNVSRDLEEGDYVGAGIETLAGLAGLAPAGGDALAKAIRTFKPKKTVKAYKLFTKGEDGNLYPLFVDADTPIKRGEYIQAVIPDSVFTAPNGKKYVPSKGTGKKKGTGDNIPIPDQATRDLLIEKGFLKAGSKAKSVKAVALRPGWHAGDSPAAPHIGNEYKGKKFRGEDQVWAEVEMPADVDWQSIANKRAELKKDGTPNVKTAHITDELPLGGFYRYKTNPNMQGNWLISGQMKINRVLDADEVKRLNKEAGVKDLPTLDELKAKKMAKGGAVMDDYQFAELEMEAPKKFAEGGMSKQMEMFDDGGLMEEGGMVDEVSGNEVPPGSTREEVRDDIPAQLSEGEFVFPADVVRYIGLENLMRMRQEAKMGLAQMEAMGQMGNSEEATMPDDLPFDMYDLEVEDDGVQDFAQGGVVQAAQGMYVSPQYGIVGYQPSQFASYGQQPMQPTQPFQPSAPVGSYTPPTQQYTPTIGGQTPTTFTGFTGIAAPGTGGYDEMKTYVNDAGMEMQIPFKDGKPIYPIPEGYTLKGDAVKTAQTQTTTGTTDTGVIQSDGDDSGDPFAGKNTVNLGGTVVKENIREGLNTYAPGQVKGSTRYAVGTSSSVTGDLSKSGIVGGIKDTVAGIVNQDQRTLTDEFGNSVAMSKGMYDTLVAEKTSKFTNDVINGIFDMQKTIEQNFGENYSKDLDNRQAKQLAKELGIEHKGQSLAEIMYTNKDAFEAEEKAEKAAKEKKTEQKKQAEEKGQEKREARKQAAAEASKYGISPTKADGTKKTIGELRGEIVAKQIAARNKSQGSSGGGSDNNNNFGSGFTSSGGRGFGAGSRDTGTYDEAGVFNKGGLVDQMEKSGLTPKK